MAAYHLDDLKSYVLADCLYTGISSGPTLGKECGEVYFLEKLGDDGTQNEAENIQKQVKLHNDRHYYKKCSVLTWLDG